MIRACLVPIAIAAILFAFPSKAQQVSVRADGSSVSIGGSVSNSTIINGVPVEKVDELVRERTRPFELLTSSQRETISLLQEKLDLNQRQIYAFFDALGDAAVPPEKTAAKLVEMAQQLKQLRSAPVSSPGDDSETISFKHDAQDAISNGNLVLADSLLAKAADRQRLNIDRMTTDVASTLGQRGQIALTRLRYLEAAQLFGDAAGLIPASDKNTSQRREYLTQKALALYNEGNEHGNTAASASAVDQYRQLLESETDKGTRALYSLGLARSLQILTFRDGDPAHLREAISTLRLIVNQSDGSVPPEALVSIKQQLATTLTALGVPENDGAMLSEAVSLFRSALSDDSIQRSKSAAAQAQSVLALALSALSSATNDKNASSEAVETMRMAVKNFDPENEPVGWSRANAFLGVILSKVGAEKRDTAILNEGAEYFRAALTRIPRDKLPFEWAQVEMTLGTALLWLGQSTRDPKVLQQSVEAIEASHQYVNAGTAPGDWTSSTFTQAMALLELGKITRNRHDISEASAKFDAALSMKSRFPHNFDWNLVGQRSDEARKLLAGNGPSK